MDWQQETFKDAQKELAEGRAFKKNQKNKHEDSESKKKKNQASAKVKSAANQYADEEMVKGGQKILSRIDWMQHKIDQTTAQADPDHVPLPILNIGRAKTNGKSKNPPNMKDGDQLTWAEGGRSLFEEVKAERMKRKALGLLNPSSESEQDEEEDK